MVLEDVGTSSYNQVNHNFILIIFSEVCWTGNNRGIFRTKVQLNILEVDRKWRPSDNSKVKQVSKWGCTHRSSLNNTGIGRQADKEDNHPIAKEIVIISVPCMNVTPIYLCALPAFLPSIKHTITELVIRESLDGNSESHHRECSTWIPFSSGNKQGIDNRNSTWKPKELQSHLSIMLIAHGQFTIFLISNR